MARTVELKDPKLWSHDVTHRPPATFPPGGMYTKSAEHMYLEMRKPTVSPNGLGSAIQMQIFFVNRAGKNLPQERKDAIWKSVEYLRIELEHLRHPSGAPGAHDPKKAEEKALAWVQNEFAYKLIARALKLGKEPKPIYPPPSAAKRIGGRNGYNGPYQP